MRRGWGGDRGEIDGTHTLWLFNIAMGNGPFIEVYLLKMVKYPLVMSK